MNNEKIYYKVQDFNCLDKCEKKHNFASTNIPIAPKIGSFACNDVCKYNNGGGEDDKGLYVICSEDMGARVDGGECCTHKFEMKNTFDYGENPKCVHCDKLLSEVPYQNIENIIIIKTDKELSIQPHPNAKEAPLKILIEELEKRIEDLEKEKEQVYGIHAHKVEALIEENSKILVRCKELCLEEKAKLEGEK